MYKGQIARGLDTAGLLSPARSHRTLQTLPDELLARELGSSREILDVRVAVSSRVPPSRAAR
jgi:hypothetical protein